MIFIALLCSFLCMHISQAYNQDDKKQKMKEELSKALAKVNKEQSLLLRCNPEAGLKTAGEWADEAVAFNIAEQRFYSMSFNLPKAPAVYDISLKNEDSVLNEIEGSLDLSGLSGNPSTPLRAGIQRPHIDQGQRARIRRQLCQPSRLLAEAEERSAEEVFGDDEHDAFANVSLATPDPDQRVVTIDGHLEVIAPKKRKRNDSNDTQPNFKRRPLQFDEDEFSKDGEC